MLRRIAIVLVVLLVLLVAADRVGDYVAEQVAASSIQDSQHLPRKPDVDIHGIPFLTQFAAGNYDKITITAQDVPIGRNPVVLRLSSLTVELDDLSVSRDFKDFHAATATATGVVGFADLSDALGAQVTYAGSGRIKADKRITVAGHSIDAMISVSPSIANGVLSFGQARLNELGTLGRQVAGALDDVFDVSIPLSGVPFDVRIRSLSVGAEGLRLQLTGRDLSYSS